jgi:outer membrane protein insertion porin family/translocation and assembly module TamA
MIGGAIFFEFGNVWEKPRDIQFSDIRANLGGGLRVNSPLGILRLDLGFNVDRRVDEPQTKIFFSMGQAF